MQSTVCREKRLIVARFDEGEDLLASLKECVAANEIRSGYFTLVGGLKELVYSIYMKGERHEFRKTKRGWHKYIALGCLSCVRFE